MVQEITSEAQYARVVRENRVVVADFYAVWCGPCRAVAPKIVELETQLGGKVTFVKVDVDKLGALAREKDVSAMPTFHVYEAGTLVKTIVGANYPAIQALATELANKPAEAPAPAAATA